MDKLQFKDEIMLEAKGADVDLDYLYNEFINKVEPNLELINHWRFNDGMKISDIGRALGLSVNVWKNLRRMETVDIYLDREGSFLGAKLQKKFLTSLEENDSNARFWDMAFKRFDKKHQEKESKDKESNNSFTFNINNGKMEDDEIKKKADNNEN